MAVMLEAIYLALGIGTGLYRYILDDDDDGGGVVADIMEEQPKPQKAAKPKNTVPVATKKVAACALVDPETMTRKIPAVKVQNVPVKSVPATITPANDADVTGEVVQALQSLGFKGKAKAMAEAATGTTAKERIASALKQHGQGLSNTSTATVTSTKPAPVQSSHKPASTADYQVILEKVRKDIQAGKLTAVTNDTLAGYTNRSRSKSTKIINDLCAEGLLKRLENRRVIVAKQAA